MLRAGDRLGASGLIVENTFGTLRGAIGTRFKAMGLPAFPVADLMLFWGSVDMGANGFAHRPVDAAARVTAPTLVLQGAHDARVEPGAAAAIDAALVGGTLVRLNSGHEPGFVTDGPEWEQAVEAFLLRVAGQGRTPPHGQRPP